MCLLILCWFMAPDTPLKWFFGCKHRISRCLDTTYIKTQIVSAKRNLKKDQLKSSGLHKEYLLCEEPGRMNQGTAWGLSPSRDLYPTGMKFLSLTFQHSIHPLIFKLFCIKVEIFLSRESHPFICQFFISSFLFFQANIALPTRPASYVEFC